VIVDCPGCGTPHESIYSAATHAWKKQDDRHAEYPDLDRAIQATVDSNDLLVDAEEVSPDDPDGQAPTGEATVDDSPTADSPGQAPATDGGPKPIPTFDDVEEDTDDPVTVDDLPDRFVDVDDYATRKGRREDVDEERLRELLESFDVVDVEASGPEAVEAFTLDEVAGGA
jgi:hypothetical protein